MDDGYWPVFGTPKARSMDAKWDMVGEGFIKELDFGRVWLRLNESDDGEREDIIAEFKSDAKEFLERALVSPPHRISRGYYGSWTDSLTLGRTPPLSLCSMIKMVRVIVSLLLRPSLFPFPSYSALAKASTVSESDLLSPYCPYSLLMFSYLDQGTLRVEIVDGRDIPAVDRGGECSHFTRLLKVIYTLQAHRTLMFQSFSTAKRSTKPRPRRSHWPLPGMRISWLRCILALKQISRSTW